VSPVPVEYLRRDQYYCLQKYLQFTTNDFSTSLDVLKLVRAQVKLLVSITKIKRLNEEGISNLTVDN
jgi:hypothetical protein